MNNKSIAGLCALLLMLSFNTYGQPNQKKSTKMKEFVLIIRLPQSYGPTEAAAVRPKWTVLTDKWKSDSIWVTSYVFPDEGYVVAGTDKISKKEYVKTSEGLKVVTTIIVRVSDIEAALALAKLCPILDQQGTVEVREIR